MRKPTPWRHPFRSRGVVAMTAALLLVAGVLVVILLTTTIIRDRSMDTARAADSGAAFAVAESGIERAQAIVGNAVSANAVTNTTCSALAVSPAFSVGRGTLTYPAAVPAPPTCGSLTTPCESCVLTARGVVGTTERDLTLNIQYGQRNGTTGRGRIATMVLRNTFGQDAFALFDLAWRRQGQGGMAVGTAASCVSCTLIWNLESSSGNPSVGSIGTAVPIAAHTMSQIVQQTLSQDRDWVEVGVLFPGVSASPTLLAAYWSDNGTMQTKANQQTSVTGATNSGVAAADTASCIRGGTVPNPPGGTTNQTCNSWCYGGDTLVYGFSGRSSSVADQLTAVTFNTAGTGGYAAQNLPMTQVVHFPNTDGSVENATGMIYGESWYYFNPAYNAATPVTSAPYPAAAHVGATTYNGAIFGRAGASNLPVAIANHATSGTYSGNAGQICVGDHMVDATGTPRLDAHVTMINGAATGCTTAAAGSFTIDSPTTSGGVNRVNVFSTQLVALATTAALSPGNATVLSGGATIPVASGPVAGVYTLVSERAVAPGYIVQGNGLGMTVYVPSGADLPAVTGTLLQVYATSPGGTGALAARTSVSSIGTATFALSSVPTTPLIGTRLCGGTCALFNEPSSTTSATSFTIAKTAGTTQWSSGFMCLSGVDRPSIIPVTSTVFTSRVWSEEVQ